MTLTFEIFDVNVVLLLLTEYEPVFNVVSDKCAISTKEIRYSGY